MSLLRFLLLQLEARQEVVKDGESLMAIFRAHNEAQGRISLRQRVLEDERLSFKARGVWAYLMTKPRDWRINYRHLMTVGPDGQRAVLSALNELGEAGYLTRSNRRDENGKWEWRYDIYEHPDKHRADVFHARKNHARKTSASSKTPIAVREVSRYLSSKGNLCESCGGKLDPTFDVCLAGCEAS